jgi:hypothetical protein
VLMPVLVDAHVVQAVFDTRLPLLVGDAAHT